MFQRLLRVNQRGKSTARDNQWLNLKNPSQADPEESIQAIFMFSRGSDIIIREEQKHEQTMLGFLGDIFLVEKLKLMHYSSAYTEK